MKLCSAVAATICFAVLAALPTLTGPHDRAVAAPTTLDSPTTTLLPNVPLPGLPGR
jgi:hypothetical protein